MKIKLDTTPFNPEEFLGKGWSFWRGPADGDGLNGDLVEDSDTELDPSKIQLKLYLKNGEGFTSGEERLLRIATAGDYPLGPRAFQTFWKNQGLIPEKLKKKRSGNEIYVFFDKVVLRGPDGIRYGLCLCWNSDRCECHHPMLDSVRDIYDPSAVLVA